VAAPSGQLKVSRYFLALAAILVVLYALVFFTGDKKPHPKLGLDLQGGTSMTLTATLPGGRTPDKGKLEQARQIIADRVDVSGVSEPDVTTEGDRNIVVNVAGKTDQEELRKLVAPAELRFRKVISSTPDQPSEEPQPSASATPQPSASAAATSSPNASATAAPSGSAKPSGSASASPAATASASPSASPAPLDESTEQQRAKVIAKLGPIYQLATGIQDPSQVDPQTLQLLGAFGRLSGEEVAALPPDIQYKVPTITCKMLDARPVGAIHDPKQQAVACGTQQGGRVKYLLDPAKVVGEDVSNAGFDNNVQEGGWIVTLQFKSSGQDKWTNLTKEAYDNGAQHQVAIVLDNVVVSAPAIESVINGDAIIRGSFTKDEVQTLSRQLKYGSLPLAFRIDSVDTVTATLGLRQMQMGVLAGGIGLALVVLYCLFYYRALGLVVIASLLVSGSLVYACLVLLGRQIGFSLSLSGIAGFIVAIGITADSFVVFFERLKDEVKDGRTVRSSVPRAWVRARRTILSADTVSFLAAAVLYILAIGAVKGFAFTLGLSTVIDLVVVFLFTHPLVALLARSSAFTSPRFSGLGNLRSDRAIAAAQATAPRFGAVRTKES
jgi:preprotein translocase subunit SecD